MNLGLLLKIADRILRTIPLPEIKSKKIPLKNIIILRPGGLGDAFLLLKHIGTLIHQNNLKVDILCENRNIKAFSLVSKINRVYSYNNKSDIRELIKKYKYYDLAVDTEQFHILSSMTARYLAKATVGFDTNIRRNNLSHSISYSQDTYEQDMFKQLFTFFANKYSLIFYEQNIKYNFLKTNITSYEILIFTGATAWQRRWETKKYITLIQKLQKYNLKIALIGGKSELNTNELIHLTCNKTDNLTNRLSINELGYLFTISKVLFSTDSGILHLGAISGIKTVSMFGSGIEKKWALKGDNHIVINKNLPCSPCTKFGYMKKCKINAKCMRDIAVDEIFDSIMKLLRLEGGK